MVNGFWWDEWEVETSKRTNPPMMRLLLGWLALVKGLECQMKYDKMGNS